MTEPRITVVGSLNMDLVAKTKNLPKAGETVLGENFSTVPGGKGNNQAIACARLGADVTMIGSVGDDTYGQELIRNLNKENVDTNHILIQSGVSTGIASIIISDEDNQIVVTPGANSYLTPQRILEKADVIKRSDIILLQLEIPLETVEKTINIAKFYQIPVILNPAPALDLPESIIDRVTILTPNEHELTQLFKGSNINEILKTHPEKIVMTKGKDGAYFANNNRNISHIPSYQVEVVDTTGAGDAFNGALAYQLSQGKNLNEATQFAVAAGALAVTKFGAQGGLPSIEEVTNMIESNLKRLEDSK